MAGWVSCWSVPMPPECPAANRRPRLSRPPHCAYALQVATSAASRAWQKPHDDQQMLTSQRSRAELENDSTISGVSRNTSPEAFIGVARR